MKLYATILFLITLLFLGHVSSDMVYYVSTTQNGCIYVHPCLTISEITLNHNFNSSTTLHFLPGNHSLHSSLLVANVSKINITSHSNTNIICQPTANIQFSNISQVYMSEIALFGCSGNRIEFVADFLIQDSSFHGQSYKESALSLMESSGSIVRTRFLSNKHGTYKSSVASLFNGYGRVGGAVLITKSNVVIINSTFEENSAEVGGAIYSEQYSNVTIASSYFIRNSVSCNDNIKECLGGVFGTESGTNITIQNSSFHGNKALGSYSSGGVFISLDSTVTVKNSSFTENGASVIGGVCVAQRSSLVIDNSAFNNNSADYGGTLHLASSTAAVTWSSFHNSKAYSQGGAIYAMTSVVQINRTTFVHSYAHEEGGVVKSVSQTRLSIFGSRFYHSSAGYGGVVSMQGPNAELDISVCEFINNTATQEGGISYSIHATLNIAHSHFINSLAYRHGGVLYASNASLVIQDSQFLDGKAYQTGSVLYLTTTTLRTKGTVVISNNVARLGVLYLLQCSAIFTDSLNLSNNLGSLIAHNSVIDFSGITTVLNGSSIRLHLPPSLSEGGAITAIQSVMNFYGKSTLMFNRAAIGGAVYSSESKLYVYTASVMILQNIAEDSGGGIFLHLSELNCQLGSNLTISGNIASHRGGGIHAISSMIKAYVSYNASSFNYNYCVGYSGAALYFIGNQAELGGGVCLDANSKLYIFKKDWSSCISYVAITFTANSADYGGALFIADETDSGVCASTSYQISSVITECSIQSIAQYRFAAVVIENPINFVNMKFVRNQAHTSGGNLHGGLLDRCTVSQFAEVYSERDDFNQPYSSHRIISGVDYFKKITNITDLDSISSNSVRICFCRYNQPKCDYSPPIYYIMKGEGITVSLVAVDQVNHTVSNTNIKSLLKSSQGGLGEGQLIQTTLTNDLCTHLNFNIYSPHDYEELTLYPEGPCKDSALSQQRIRINFLPCHCPVGLQPKVTESSNCICECDSRLQHYISECNPRTGIIVREGTFWISFINTTNDLESTVNNDGFLIHPYCPFDYCKPSDSKIEIDLENGSDAQCAHNRTGVLCGMCQHGFSLSLGSSRCIQCNSHWPVTLVATLIGAVIAGVLLVVILLLLNLTVAVGTLNGIILYANIVATYRSTFFPVSETNVITVFIAWLNFEIGVDLCFWEGIDAYYKTWLQMVFPVFVIFLVIVVILVSEHCTKFAHLIGKKNPVAVLATLILLSYAKLLSTVIAALSFTILEFPDGSRKAVWLLDASVGYLKGKHIALFITSLVVLLCGMGFTALIFSWQWLLHHKDRKILRWLSGNMKISLFIEPYHAPFTFKHRYWTGLLLFIRVVLNITSAVNVSGNPGLNLLAIGAVMTFLLLLRSCVPGSIYRKKLVDILELTCLFNIILLCFATFFVIGSSSSNQNIPGYIFGSSTLLLFLVVGVYHVIFELCLKIKCIKRLVSLDRQRRQSQADDGEALINMSQPLEDSGEVECSVSIVDAPPRDEKPLTFIVGH